jgi:hypothetical protein
VFYVLLVVILHYLQIQQLKNVKIIVLINLLIKVHVNVNFLVLHFLNLMIIVLIVVSRSVLMNQIYINKIMYVLFNARLICMQIHLMEREHVDRDVRMVYGLNLNLVDV